MKKLEVEEKWNQIAADNLLEKTAWSLTSAGMEAKIVAGGEEAKKLVLGMIAKGAEVFTMSSVTLDTIGLSQEINESGKFNSVRNKLFSLDRKTQGVEMQKLGAAPEYTIGSVHAITVDGSVVIASNTGSQLSAYAYGAEHVIWVVGAQKIVKNLDQAMKRIYDYVLPLESERARKAYGVPGSNVSKVLIVNKEITPERIKIILVKEKLGF